MPCGDCRSVSLTTGPGKVSTLLADGDWLSLFFSSSQSTADPRRCFNHLWYGTVAQQAAPHAPSLLSLFTSRGHIYMHIILHVHIQYMYTCSVPIPADSCSKYSIRLEYAAKLPDGPNQLFKKGK